MYVPVMLKLWQPFGLSDLAAFNCNSQEQQVIKALVQIFFLI